MTDTTNGAPRRTIVSKAYEGETPPGVLSVGLVSLVELCQHAMPDPAKIRAKMAEANLERVSQAQADRLGAALGLETRVLRGPVRNLRHELYAKERSGALVLLLVSEADAENSGGATVFCSTFFTGATEADVVKAVTHVTKTQPSGGNVASDPEGRTLRRVYWEIPDTAGVRFFMASGPGDMDADRAMRAVTAINKAI